MKDFKDKTIVVTGAGSGMGRAYAIEFAKLGARLALNDYDAQGLDETLALLKDVPGLRTVRGAFDVSDRAAMERFAAEVQATLGNAHVVINNAGIEGSGRPMWATPLASYERVLRINFYGVVHGSQVFLPQLLLTLQRQRQRGLFISSCSRRCGSVFSSGGLYRGFQ